MKFKNFLWFLPFIFFLSGFFITRSFFYQNQFAAPSVVGTNLYEAFTTLSNHNLSLRLTEQKIDPHLSDGIVLSQTPAPGQLVKSRQTVFVTIARQPAPLATPDFLGKSSHFIAHEAKKMAFTSTQYELTSVYPTNYCVAQLPQPGEPVPAHGVIVYISKQGPHIFIWPNFIQKPLIEVIEFLNELQISPQIIELLSNSRNQPTVIDQRPLPGSLISLEPHSVPIVQLYVQ